MKTKFKVFLCLLITIVSLFCFCGCQSTDKKEAYFESDLEQAELEYNELRNKTEIVFLADVDNGTIYKIRDFSVTVNLYREGVGAQTETFRFRKSVKSGDDYLGHLSFSGEGIISEVEFVSWSANYCSFWETYNVLLIVSISLLVVALVTFIVFMIIEDLEFSDIFESCWWVLIPLTIFVGICFFVNWVMGLIVLGAIFAFFALGGIATLIYDSVG